MPLFMADCFRNSLGSLYDLRRFLSYDRHNFWSHCFDQYCSACYGTSCFLPIFLYPAEMVFA